ncbi:hypothetical protein PG996_011888 [Apiospora saccharicola]|uniref:Uncharacterized protein n=1 Tax=Apiospora saccharicola TaxID=335842 RepID=A0ABR1UIN3_9PEZI
MPTNRPPISFPRGQNRANVHTSSLVQEVGQKQRPSGGVSGGLGKRLHSLLCIRDRFSALPVPVGRNPDPEPNSRTPRVNSCTDLANDPTQLGGLARWRDESKSTKRESESESESIQPEGGPQYATVLEMGKVDVRRRTPQQSIFEESRCPSTQMRTPRRALAKARMGVPAIRVSKEAADSK